MKRRVYITWFIILLIWSFYRANFRLPEAIDELVIKPLVFVFPVLYVVLYKEKKTIESLGLEMKQPQFMVDLYIGVLIGVAFALEGLLANYVKYHTFSFTPLLGVKQGVFAFFVLNLATSTWEEILARGFMYQRFFSVYNNQFYAAIASSSLFFLLHVPIMFAQLHLMGVSLIIYPISILLLSIANCYILSLRKSLVLPILIHTFWNMTVALYL